MKINLAELVEKKNQKGQQVLFLFIYFLISAIFVSEKYNLLKLLLYLTWLLYCNEG